MPIPAFPTTINNLAQRGTFSRKPGNPTRRSEFDSGPDRVRMRYSNAPDNFVFQILLNGEETLILDGFFKYVTKYGSLWMTMPLVIGRDYVNAECRFMRDSYSINDAGFDKFLASVNIEVRNAPTTNAVTLKLFNQYGAVNGPTGILP